MKPRDRHQFRRPSVVRRAWIIAQVVAVLGAVLGFVGCEGPTGPQGPPGDGPGSLVDPAILPRVIYTYPPAGGTAPFPELYQIECGYYGYYCEHYPVLQLRFNKNMNLESVRNSLGLSSSGGNIGIVPGNVYPVGGNVFIIHPSDAGGRRLPGFLGIGETYRLSVDSGAMDVNGNSLVGSFLLTFTPEPEFRVVGVIPRDGEMLGSLQTIVRISFNGRIDSSVLRAVRFSPPVPDASWSFGYPRTSIQASIQLRGSTRYTVSIDTSAADVSGHRLPAEYAWSFIATPFKVEEMFPSDGESGVSPYVRPRFLFSEPIDTATLRGALTFTPIVEYGFYPEGRYVSIYPRRPFEPSTRYLVVVDSTLRSLAGASFPGGFGSAFTTGPLPPLAVQATYPRDGDRDAYPSTHISVTFNQPVDTSSVPGAFLLDPAVPGRFYFEEGFDTYQVVFLPGRQFVMGGTVRVTIDTSIRSAGGEPLRHQHVFSFTTTPLRVRSIWPLDGTTDVAPSHLLRVAFNGAIDTTSLAGAFSLDPPTTGHFTDDGARLQFWPVTGWIPDTTYTIRFDTTLRARGGGTLEFPYTSSFRTAPFNITQHTPPDGIDDQRVDYPIWIFCNGPIDTSSVGGAFTLTDSAGTAVSGRLLFSDYYRDQFGFLPSEWLRPGSPYVVSVNTGLRSAGGYPIAAPLTFSFRTAP